MAAKTARRTKSARRKEPVTAAAREVDRLEREVFRAKERLSKARRRVPEVEVPDYQLTRSNGRSLRLSDAFGAKRDLIVIHNMGSRCSMCTTWADGFSGIAHHIEDRAAFLLVSPDAPKKLGAFAKARRWRFAVASTAGSTFSHDMGFEPAPRNAWPGVSTFHREPDGRIFRVAKTLFGPGDDFCAVFSLLPLLRDGQDGWWPKLSYGAKQAPGPAS